MWVRMVVRLLRKTKWKAGNVWNSSEWAWMRMTTKTERAHRVQWERARTWFLYKDEQKITDRDTLQWRLLWPNHASAGCRPGEGWCCGAQVRQVDYQTRKKVIYTQSTLRPMKPHYGILFFQAPSKRFGNWCVWTSVAQKNTMRDFNHLVLAVSKTHFDAFLHNWELIRNALSLLRRDRNKKPSTPPETYNWRLLLQTSWFWSQLCGFMWQKCICIIDWKADNCLRKKIHIYHH